jgi:co-chaperonin GroES (HSP10)
MAVKGKLIPLHDKVFVSDMNFGMEKTKGGILLHSDDGKSSGLHPRWAKVWAIGKEQTELKVGQWVLMMHGRWTRGIEVENEDGEIITVRVIDMEGVLLVSDEEPEEDGVRMSVGAMNFNIPG